MSSWRVEFLDVGGALVLLPAVDREQAGDQQRRRQQHAQREAAHAAEAADHAAGRAPLRAPRRTRACACGARARARAPRAGARRCARRASRPGARLVQGLADLVAGELCISFMTFRRHAARSRERCGQSMRRPGAVRLHAALRASHGLGGLRDVQFLPVTHEESLALTRRQAAKLLFNDFKNLSPFQLVRRRFLAVGVAGLLQGFQRILVVLLAAPGARRGQQRWSTASAPSGAGTSRGSRSAGCAGTAAAALRRRGRRSSRQPQHRVLHDVERRFLVADGEHRLLEGAPLDARQERRQFTARCQFSLPSLLPALRSDGIKPRPDRPRLLDRIAASR